ncbi:MAG: hypothetical protein CMP28_01225 [Roseibacillus sp.]|nr:hypothetical protein [Roseibacillus sp.]
MKSLFFTAILVLGIAHTGAFLTIWDLPYVDNHITKDEFARKLNNVFKWDEKFGSLREAREKAAEDNYALYKATPEQAARRNEQEESVNEHRHQGPPPGNRR